MPMHPNRRRNLPATSGARRVRRAGVGAAAIGFILTIIWSVPIVAANTAPVASDSSRYVFTDTPAEITLPASDTDGDFLMFSIVSGPAHGALDDCTFGTCTYTPDPGYTGGDSFTWSANDGTTDSNVATMTLTIGAPIGRVLILASTVTDGASSREASAAAAQGYDADVVDDATWSTMTTAQFDAYAALVLGDPTCGSEVPAVAEANRTTWSSVITGNVVVIGTDPVFHEGQGGGQLTDSAMAYVLASTGSTGLYVTLSCYYDGAADNTPVPLLDQFGTFEVRGAECFNDAHIVAEHPALAGLDDADLSDWSCSVHEVFQEWPLDFVVLAIAEAFGAEYTAPDGSVGSPYILAAGDITVASDIDLAPLTATNPIGAAHELTATVANDGGPIVGTTVTFSVIDGPHTGAGGTGVTDASGVATFSYVGTTLGTDTIKATFVDSEARTQTSNLVTKQWVVVANPPPVVDAGGPYAITEGSTANLDGTVTNEPLTDTVTTLWSYTAGAGVDAGATCSFGSASSVDTTISCTDDGTYTLTLTANDGVNPPVSDTATFVVNNSLPAVDITTPSADTMFGIGDSVAVSATISDPGMNDTHTCSVDWGDGTVTPGTVSAGACAGSHAYAAAGPYTITVTVTDDDGGVGTDTVAIVVGTNPSPTADAGGPYAGTEGSATILDGTVTNEPETDTVTTLWSYAAGADVDAGATCTFASATLVDTSVTCTDDGTYTLTLTANDGVNSAVTDTATLTLANADPSVEITAPADTSIFGTGSTVNVSATISDPGANDTHTCSIDWGDGTVTPGSVSAGVCTGSHSYAPIGVYTITVTVTDDDGGVGTDEIMIVVSDQTAKVTGGGFITDGGRASFGFVAKQDAAGLEGQIQLRVPGHHRFHGSTVTSLTISGNTATWTGTGSWDGVDGYTYEATIADNRTGGKKTGPADSFKIVIRDAAGTQVFAASGLLKGGNVTIH